MIEYNAVKKWINYNQSRQCLNVPTNCLLSGQNTIVFGCRDKHINALTDFICPDADRLCPTTEILSDKGKFVARTGFSRDKLSMSRQNLAVGLVGTSRQPDKPVIFC